MGSLPQSTTLDILQAEFSPPLDSSLIAAIIADYDDLSDSANQMQSLWDILMRLAAQAEKEIQGEDILSEQLSSAHISPYSVSDGASSFPDVLSPGGSTTTSSSSSDSSSQQSFASPLGFLQAAFPDVPTSKLKRVLKDLGNADDLDMESAVEHVLSAEYVRELEERGLEGLDDLDIPEDYNAQWLTVETKKAPQKAAKKNKKRGTTFTLIDVRQKQRERTPPMSPRPAVPDPWTQLSSVASYLSALIPTHPASYFQSVFHSPENATPAKAVRAALRSIASTSGASSSELELELMPGDTTSLFTMFDVLNSMPEHAELNTEERDQMMEDAQLALRATQGQPDTALDIVGIIRELDSDSTSGEFAWGVYHSPAAQSPRHPSFAAYGPAKTLRINLPSGPPPAPPPPHIRPRSPENDNRIMQPPANAWKTVPQRQPSGPHPLVEVIPAYKRKVRGGGNGLGKGGKGDVGELISASRQRGMQELKESRRKALKEAGRAWQKGNTKTRGGEIALYYAERARELQQQALQEQLGAAMEIVQAKRTTSVNGGTVDLHGTTIVEAVYIVKDILRESGSSPSKPLRVITGRGTHSVNGVGVLGPAIKNALQQDGWVVASFDGGLVVR
ncbi:uncharacterized protein LAESUDRAFT_673470, partial [Laetiporus sulphureus 93-53]